MAKKVMTTGLRNKGDKEPGLNLSFAVGPAGTNGRGDVMLAQALLNLIAEGHRDASMVGLLNNELPDTSDSFDGLTQLALIRFHTKWVRFVYPTIRGLIYPADFKKYQDSEILVGDGRRPAMVMLHGLASDAAGRLGEPDYTLLMAKRFPQLKPFIK